MKKYCLISLLICACLLTGCVSKEEKAQKLYLSAVEEYTVHNFSKALVLLDASLKTDGSFYQSQFLKAKILFFNSEYDESLKIFNSLTRKHPEYTEARIWKIRTLILADKLDEAQKALDKEISFNATDWRVFYLYSLLYKKQGVLDKEIIMLSNAEKTLKDSAKVYSAMAYDWNVLGLTDKEKSYKEMSKKIAEF